MVAAVFVCNVLGVGGHADTYRASTAAAWSSLMWPLTLIGYLNPKRPIKRLFFLHTFRPTRLSIMAPAWDEMQSTGMGPATGPV